MNKKAIFKYIYICAYIHHKRKNLLNCNLTETICFSGLHLAGQTLRSRCSHFTTGVSRSHGLWCLKGPRVAGTFAMPIFDPLKSRCICWWLTASWLNGQFLHEISLCKTTQCDFHGPNFSGGTRCGLAQHLGFHGAREPRRAWRATAERAGAVARSLTLSNGVKLDHFGFDTSMNRGLMLEIWGRCSYVFI